MGKRFLKWISIIVLLLLAVHPVRYMILNHPYEYIYFNELTGGLKGAYGNYETDYYYTGQTEASEWLIEHLKNKGVDSARIMATFSVDWPFRHFPEYTTGYLRFEERNLCDWDYAVITNRYIPPSRLKNGTWPSENAIKNIYADGVPICSVLERKTKADYYGYQALREGRCHDAITYFKEAVKFNEVDEMIFYNFARALIEEGHYSEADSVLAKALKINPFFEPALMYSGNIAVAREEPETAIGFYEKLISVNMKYYDAYVKLAALLTGSDRQRARRLLRDCLRINPAYKPAIIALGDTYLSTDIEIAEKYYRLADTID